MPSGHRFAVLSGALAVTTALLAAGCDDPTLAGKEVPSSALRTVEAHGRVLDQQAGPEDVVFVLLQAVRQDIQAFRSHDKEASKEALALEISLAAREWMYAKYKQNLQRASMPVQVSPDVAVYKLVIHWAPLLAYYAEAFDRDYSAALRNMLVRHQPDSDDAVVFYDVPSTSGPSPATVRVELRREQQYWRIRRICFSDTSAALLRGQRATPAVSTSSPQPQSDA